MVSGASAAEGLEASAAEGPEVVVVAMAVAVVVAVAGIPTILNAGSPLERWVSTRTGGALSPEIARLCSTESSMARP